jgi:hypothetical protein
MSFRTIAVGAGMLAALALATTWSAPAATAGTAASASSVHARAAKPQHRAVRKQREAAKARHGRRARLASTRHRHRISDEPSDEPIRRATTPVRETSVAARQQTSAARRFREFLNPQSFAVSVSEELRGPRLLSVHFSGEITDPEVVVASLAGPIAASSHEDAPPSLAHDQTTGDDSPSSAPTLAHSDPATVVQRAAPAGKEPERMSFLRWLFVAWGGVLTFASAVRMAVG